ncbi:MULTISPECIES: hypothetical protein [Sphingobacterium]|uniref:hypothetical protein n=1 Tax=Sphingobacterium TaxID=28453 RepID=UPI0009632314|nr:MULTISPECIES: hypothetical protein [Sphingobacterium]OJZ08388.1 MAG: hypothetical protein BGP15_18425 [Sphingobacterium sp. 40-24]HAK31396.1 hypothetical protein [Sphingobacterium sp.]
MDVFKPFLQRLSQPILLSFCIAWIFWNWEIVVALCWYDAKSIEKLGSKNHVAYISAFKDTWRNYYYPLIIALAYPLIILILNNFHTFFKMLEEKLFTRIVKNATVPTDLYLDAQDQIEAKEKRISKFISKETEMQGQINDLTVSNKNLENKAATLAIEYSETLSIKKDLEDKAQVSDNNIDLYKKRSNIEYLMGSYKIEIHERIHNNNLTTIFSSNLEIKKSENDDKILINLIIFNYIMVSEITEYFYNILTGTIGIKTKLVNNTFSPENKTTENIVTVLQNELMNDFVNLPLANSNDILIMKNVNFNESSLRMDLAKNTKIKGA